MSDLAAVRIHSKTISIFSSRPIISRKRCTDGDWSSVLTVARRSRNASSSSVSGPVSGRSARYCAGGPGSIRDHAEVGQFAHAVFHVEPQPAERLHQRLDVERFVGPGIQVAEDAGAQRRLHERAEACIELRHFRRTQRCRHAGAPRAEQQIVHFGVRFIGRCLRRATGPAAGRPAGLEIVVLVRLDERLHLARVALAVAVAPDRTDAAARLDQDVGQ